jgi:hypothetical protein
MDTTLALTLLSTAGVSLGLAMLLGHPTASRVLAILGTILFGTVLAVLLLT